MASSSSSPYDREHQANAVVDGNDHVSEDLLLPGFLAALQWTDTAFPSGMYTLSHGLEGLSHYDWLDRASLSQTVHELITEVVSPTDGIAAALSWDWAHSLDKTFPRLSLATPEEFESLRTIDELLLATKPSENARRGSVRVGKQLLSMASDVVAPEGNSALGVVCGLMRRGELVGNQAVVAGVIHHHHGMSQTMAVACELFSLAAGVCSAAVRLRVADHISSQEVLCEVRPDIIACARRCCSSSLDDIGTLSPALDVASAAHETAPARLFIN